MTNVFAVDGRDDRSERREVRDRRVLAERELEDAADVTTQLLERFARVAARYGVSVTLSVYGPNADVNVDDVGDDGTEER